MDKVYLYNANDNDAALQYIRMITDSIQKTNYKIEDLMYTELGRYVIDNEMLIGLCDSLTAVASYQDLIKKQIKLVARD